LRSPSIAARSTCRAQGSGRLASLISEAPTGLALLVRERRGRTCPALGGRFLDRTVNLRDAPIEIGQGLRLHSYARAYVSAFARTMGVSPMRVSHLIKGKRPVTGELALRLGKVLSQSPQYWLHLQAGYDLAQAKAAIGRKLKGLHVLPQLG